MSSPVTRFMLEDDNLSIRLVESGWFPLSLRRYNVLVKNGRLYGEDVEYIGIVVRG